MIKVQGSTGVEIGRLVGKWVFSLTGEIIYWIDEGEVFSVPEFASCSFSGRRPCIKIGEIDGEVAKDEFGSLIFKIV